MCGNHNQPKHPKDRGMIHSSRTHKNVQLSWTQDNIFTQAFTHNRTLKQNLNPFFFFHKQPSSTTMLKIVAEIEGVAIKENIDHHMGLNFELNLIIKI